MPECSEHQSNTPAQTGNIALLSFKNSSFQTLPGSETQMLLLHPKQCLQEQARHIYGTTLCLSSCQMPKVCSDTCSALHQDLPKVSRDRGSSDVDTGWESCLPSLRHTAIPPGRRTQRKHNPVRCCFSPGSMQEFHPLPAVDLVGLQSGFCSSQLQHRAACAPAPDIPVAHLRSPGVREQKAPGL